MVWIFFIMKVSYYIRTIEFLFFDLSSSRLEDYESNWHFILFLRNRFAPITQHFVKKLRDSILQFSSLVKLIGTVIIYLRKDGPSIHWKISLENQKPVGTVLEARIPSQPLSNTLFHISASLVQWINVTYLERRIHE